MAVTVNDLREQVIRLEAVCEEYVRDKDDFMRHTGMRTRGYAAPSYVIL